MKYHDYNNMLQKIKRSAKHNYYHDKCEEYKNNTRKLWKTINHVIHKMNNKSDVIEKLKINNLEEYQRQVHSLKNLLRYFAGIGEEYATKMPQPRMDFAQVLSQPNSTQPKKYLPHESSHHR